ncbi:retrovirus-related pol polyprotein from transposon TNT 1-94 [Tanacetum coccineum]
MILLGADNRPPMLEKDMYDSWKSIMELYMINRQHEQMILESVENDPLIWPTIEENGVTRPRKYFELTHADAIQADCDVKATNIILQGLPPEVYALLSNQRIAKELWKRIQLLMQGTSLMKQEREFNQQPQQSEFPQPDAGLTVLVFKQGDDPIDAIDHMMSFLSAVVISRYPTTNNQLRNSSNPRTYTPGASGSNSRKQRTVICYNCKGEGHMSKECTKLKRKQDDSWFKDKVLLVQAQANGQILHEEELVFLADPGISKDILAEVHNPDNMINQDVQSVKIARLKQTLSEHLKEKESLMQTVTLLKNDFRKEESKNIDREIALEKKIKQLDNIVNKRDQSAQTVHMLTKYQFFYDHNTKQALGFQNPFYLKKAQWLEPKLYDGNVIKSTSAIVIPDSEETLMLAEESHPSPSCRPTKVEVPKELPKVNMVNTSLKKLKHHFADFDVVIKERTTVLGSHKWTRTKKLRSLEDSRQKSSSKDNVN